MYICTLENPILTQQSCVTYCTTSSIRIPCLHFSFAVESKETRRAKQSNNTPEVLFTQTWVYFFKFASDKDLRVINYTSVFVCCYAVALLYNYMGTDGLCSVVSIVNRDEAPAVTHNTPVVFCHCGEGCGAGDDAHPMVTSSTIYVRCNKGTTASVYTLDQMTIRMHSRINIMRVCFIW